MKKFIVLVVVLVILGAVGYGAYRFVVRSGPAAVAAQMDLSRPAQGAAAALATQPAAAAQDAGAGIPVDDAAREFDESRDALLALLARTSPGSSATPEQTSERLADMFSRLEGALPGLSKASFDVDAVKTTAGPQPEALFEWVRDQTSWVPYQGTLRGATGVLMDRLGNSLDRALLLSALITASGGRAKLAHATLPREQAADIVRLARPASGVALSEPGGSRPPLADSAVGEFSRVMGIDGGAARVALSRLEDAAAYRLSVARAAVQRQAVALVAAVGQTPAAPDDAVAAAADHWWVVIDQDGQPFALDPTLPDAKPGQSFSAPRETIDPARVPQELWHTVRIAVVAEFVSGAQAREQVVLSRTVRPSDLFGQQIALNHQPATWRPPTAEALGEPEAREAAAQALRDEREWQVQLSVGAKITDRAVIRTGGGAEPSRESSGVAGAGSAGLWGGLSGAESSPRPGELTAEWIEFEIRVPGRPPTKIRRDIFDIHGPAARQSSAANRGSLSDPERLLRALALSGETVILPLVCRVSPEYVTWLRARAALTNRRVLLAAVGGAALPDAEARQLASSMTPMPSALYALALARHAWNDRAQDVFLAEPNIVALHRTFRGDAAGGVAAVEGLDIVANAVAVRANASVAPFDARVHQGVADSYAEDYLLLGAEAAVPAGSAGNSTETAGQPSAGWVMVRAQAQADALSVSADVKARIGRHLGERFVVVAPAGAPSSETRWWRIDPSTGGTLRVGDFGWGQVFTEQNIMHARQGLQVLSYTFCSARSIFGPDRFEKKEMAVAAVCIVGGAFGILGVGPSKIATTLYFALAKDVVTIVGGNAVLILM